MKKTADKPVNERKANAEAKRQERIAKREAKRQAALEKLEQDTGKKSGRPKNSKKVFNREQTDVINTMIKSVCQDAIQTAAIKIANEKFAKFEQQIPNIQIGKVFNREYVRPFTSEQLIKIFGGWFTCKYLFSMNLGEKRPVDGKEVETDFWICSQDVSMMRANERPPRNEPIYKQFGVEVFGFAIIAPSSAF